MSDNGAEPAQISDSALRIIMQKLDSMSSTIKDTQMRVQKLEEDKKDELATRTLLANPTDSGMIPPEERPWLPLPEHGNLDTKSVKSTSTDRSPPVQQMAWKYCQHS